MACKLEILRAAAAREILGAVYRYFVASQEAPNEIFEDEMTFQEYFAHESADEMVHYVELMRMISALDPVQSEEFTDHGLAPYLVEDQYPPITFWFGPYTNFNKCYDKRWLKTVQNVVETIAFELETINQYEQAIQRIGDRSNRQALQEIMDHEKGDVADLNQILFLLLAGEPPEAEPEPELEPDLDVEPEPEPEPALAKRKIFRKKSKKK